MAGFILLRAKKERFPHTLKYIVYQVLSIVKEQHDLRTITKLTVDAVLYVQFNYKTDQNQLMHCMQYACKLSFIRYCVASLAKYMCNAKTIL